MNCNNGNALPRTEEALRKRGLRITALRKKVIELFLKGGCLLSASEVHASAGGSSDLSSVYRTLSALCEAGFLREARSADGLMRYRLSDSWGDGHDHFLCSRCGAVTRISRSFPMAIKDRLESTYGFIINRMDLHVDGLCERCAPNGIR